MSNDDVRNLLLARVGEHMEQACSQKIDDLMLRTHRSFERAFQNALRVNMGRATTYRGTVNAAGREAQWLDERGAPLATVRTRFDLAAGTVEIVTEQHAEPSFVFA